MSDQHTDSAAGYMDRRWAQYKAVMTVKACMFGDERGMGVRLGCLDEGCFPLEAWILISLAGQPHLDHSVDCDRMGANCMSGASSTMKSLTRHLHNHS